MRVLQYADVVQKDWWGDQFIPTYFPNNNCDADAEDPLLACVLIDFGLSAIGDVWYEVEKQNCWSDLAIGMVSDMWGHEDGCEAELMRKYYEPREAWDIWRRGWEESPTTTEIAGQKAS